MTLETLEQNTLLTPRMAAALSQWQRLFYGRETPAGAHPTALAPALTAYLATLVTAELTISLGGGPRAEFLEKQLLAAMPTLQLGVQLAAAEGMCALRPRMGDGGLELELIPASRMRLRRVDGRGRPLSGCFLDWRTAGKEELLRLEDFDFSQGRLTVTNRAYRLKGQNLQELPLDTLEDWGKLEKETVVEQVTGPLFGLIRMPFAGTVEPGSPLPVSLFAQATESLKEFDRLYGELLYELHSGKRKRILERQALPNLTGKPLPGAPGYQDLATDTYLVLDPMEQQKPFDDYSPVMRTEEYLTALKSLLHLIENQCHLSPGALALDVGGEAPVTATEVVSRDRTTYHTCAALQTQALQPALEELTAAMDALADLYDLAPPGEYALTVAFGDGVFEDTEREFQRQLQLVTAGILKPEKLLSWYYHVEEDAARRDYLQGKE